MERLNPGWRTSSHSGNGGANCIETGNATDAVLIRDTKDRGTGPVLRVTPAAWRQFTASVKN